MSRPHLVVQVGQLLASNLADLIVGLAAGLAVVLALMGLVWAIAVICIALT